MRLASRAASDAHSDLTRTCKATECVAYDGVPNARTVSLRDAGTLPKPTCRRPFAAFAFSRLSVSTALRRARAMLHDEHVAEWMRLPSVAQHTAAVSLDEVSARLSNSLRASAGLRLTDARRWLLTRFNLHCLCTCAGGRVRGNAMDLCSRSGTCSARAPTSTMPTWHATMPLCAYSSATYSASTLHTTCTPRSSAILPPQAAAMHTKYPQRCYLQTTNFGTFTPTAFLSQAVFLTPCSSWS